MVEQPWTDTAALRVPRDQLPLALASVHLGLAPGDSFELRLPTAEQRPGGRTAQVVAGEDRTWHADEVSTVVVGAGFSIDGVETTAGLLVVRATRERTLPDFVGPGMRLLVCGLNPSLYAADRGVGYARPGNRFWPAAMDAGLVARDGDPWHALTTRGVGMTDLVKRATVGAAELTTDDYCLGAARVERVVRWLRPAAVCFVGLAGWRVAMDRKAVAGRQPRPFGGCPAYVMPSTSGRNACTSLAELAGHLAAAASMVAVAPGRAPARVPG